MTGPETGEHEGIRLMSRIIVLGGGIVGASAAFHLARDGADTILVDRRDMGQATPAGAGIVAPGTSLRDLPGFYTLAMPAVGYYPKLLAALEDVEAGATGYGVVGKVFVAETGEEAERLDDVRALFTARALDGMPNMGVISVISAAEATELFPPLRDVQRALFISGAARVDGGLLRDALVAGARHHGAKVRYGDARLVREQGRVAGVELDGERIDADRVVLAAGSWSNEVFDVLGFSLPVAPQRGQIVHIQMAGQDTSLWPIVAGFGHQYIVSFGPDRVVAGATRETGSGFDVRMTPGGVQDVLNTALRIAPGLANGTLREVRVGLRPLSDDGLPFLGFAPGHDNVVISTGHGASGLQLGPYSGKLAAELALDKDPSTDIAPFAVDRGVSLHERNMS
jgi:D-amino-acid dehydrogenase